MKATEKFKAEDMDIVLRYVESTLKSNHIPKLPLPKTQEEMDKILKAVSAAVMVRMLFGGERSDLPTHNMAELAKRALSD